MQMIEFAGNFATLEDIKSKPANVQQQALALLSAGLLQAKPVKMTRPKCGSVAGRSSRSTAARYAASSAPALPA